MPEAAPWVADTSVYTHLSRAGHINILERLAPGGLILLPSDVDSEVQEGRTLFPSIVDPASTSLAKLTVLTEDEVFTQLAVKASAAG